MIWEVRLDDRVLVSTNRGVILEKVTWAGRYRLVYSLRDTSGDKYLYTISWSRETGETRIAVPLVYPPDGREGGRPLDGTRLDGQEPAGSPDGRTIAFAQLQGENRHIVLCDLPLFDGGEEPYRAQCQSLRTLPGRGNNISPSWSPDGRWIYFVSDRDGNKEIYRIHPDGTGEERLTDNTTDDTSPAPFAPHASCH